MLLRILFVLLVSGLTVLPLAGCSGGDDGDSNTSSSE